jgi:hypothetical protein
MILICSPRLFFRTMLRDGLVDGFNYQRHPGFNHAGEFSRADGSEAFGDSRLLCGRRKRQEG